MLSATSAGFAPILDNSESYPYTWPTLAETLQEAGVTWRVLMESDYFGELQGVLLSLLFEGAFQEIIGVFFLHFAMILVYIYLRPINREGPPLHVCLLPGCNSSRIKFISAL